LPIFGEKLRRQRELRGLSIEAIANSTKISTRMLRAIEDEHFDQLPGGVFNKGFVRAYARQIGLDEDDAVAGYLTALRDSQIGAPAISPNFRTARVPSETLLGDGAELPPGNQDRKSDAAPDFSDGANTPLQAATHASEAAPEVHADEATGEKFRKRDSLDAGARLAGIRDAGTAEDPTFMDHPFRDHPFRDRAYQDRPFRERRFEERRVSDRRTQERRRRTSLQLLKQKPGGLRWGMVAAALLLILVPLAWRSRHRHVSSAAAASPVSAPSASIRATALETSPQPVASAPAHHANGTMVKTDSPSLTAGNSKATPSSSGATRAASSANPPTESGSMLPERTKPAKATPPARFTLLIRASQTSWISIVADGEPVARETLIAPAQTAVRATREIVIKTGNAGGISFRLNGRAIPASGENGEVKTYTFDASGLRASNVAQVPPPAQ
jgi:hypothetical protein